MKRIVIFGNKQIAIEVIKMVSSVKEAELVAVVGCETKTDLQLGSPSLKKYCVENNICYYAPERLDNDFYKVFQNMHPDLCLSIFYRNIFSKKYIKIPRKGFINIHPSLLPKYRGPVPSMWAMLNKEEWTGVTIHYIDEGVDTGDILFQQRVHIPINISGFELVNVLERVGVKMMNKNIRKIIRDELKPIKQIHNDATYYALYNNMLRKIDWFVDSEGIVAKVNTFTKPYLGAFGLLKGEEIIVWKAEIIRRSRRNLKGPGRIIGKSDCGYLVVSTVDGHIGISDYEYSKEIRVGERFEIYSC